MKIQGQFCGVRPREDAKIRPGSALTAAMCLLIVVGCGAGTNGSAAPVLAASAATPPAATAAPVVSVKVSGPMQVRLGTTGQMTATVTNTTNMAVTWQVNGVAGGGPATGTISTAGLFTAPAALPASPYTVTITAVSQAAPTASGSLTETIDNPTPAIATASAVGTGPSYLLDVLGSGFVNGSQLQVSGTTVANTMFVSPMELQATITLPTGTASVPVDVSNPNPGALVSNTATASVTVYKASLSTAARLLDQATFGPTLADIQHVQSVGVNAYLTEQFNTPTTVMPAIPNPAPLVCMNSTIPCEQSEWWQTVLTGKDQLRQRVAFALSEIFVVSTNSVNAESVVTYNNTLANDAFTNYYTIMHDVALSPAMGNYLNMVNSYKPGNGQIANENWARELMQLFTTGLDMLNSDGTRQSDVFGNAIPVYTEAQVEAFARAYTGWTYANATGTAPPVKFPNPANFDAPLGPVESAHDVAVKVLLNGTTLPANQTTTQDLTGALQNIFAHQNVGPFVSRQLIQHLVASDPSPAYVARVAAVFANNGKGVRGDMKAVITAILTDVDARANDTSPNFDGGHLREPMLYIADVMRALNFTNNDAAAGKDVVANASYANVSNYTAPLGERPYSSGSVFNFFPPDYVIPGTAINAPEFGQENTATAILRLTLADQLVFGRIGGFSVDLSKTSALGITASKTGNAMTDSANLVDALSVMFLHGQMPANMRTAIVNHVATLTDPAMRVRVATYLVITSSIYKIEY